MTYVIVACGESNSGGQALNSSALSAELAARPEVSMWVPGADTFQPLDIGTNNNVNHAGLTSATHSWELQLANDIAADVWSQSPMYYIQTGQGGSRMSQWDASDAYWIEWLDRVDKAKAYFASNAITPEWIVWLSIGINDAIAGNPIATTKAALIAWIDRIKIELPGCVIALTEVTPSWPDTTTMIREIADSEDDVCFVYTQDATLRDSNHWDYAGMKLVSTRLTKASQIQLGILDGQIFTNYTSIMYPDGQRLKWTGNSPTNAGAISKEPMEWLDGDFVRWITTGTTANTIVVALESTKDTGHLWNSGQTFIYCAYRHATNFIYSGTVFPAVIRDAASDEVRILRSGDDALLQTRVTAGSWATIYTEPGVFSGITEVYVHVINASTTSTDVLTLSFPFLPYISVTAPDLADIWLADLADDITWTSSDITGDVDIFVAINGGAFTLIEADVANSGTYSWTPESGHVSASVQIKVQSSDAPEFYDTSPVFYVATTEPSSGISSDTTTATLTRSVGDENPITFSFPVSGATIAGTMSKNNAAYVAVNGAIAFLRSESGRHYYTLAFDEDDRLPDEGQVRYKFTDGTYTAYVNLRVEVAELDSATLKRFVTEDTGETAAVAGSVAKLSQGSGGSGDGTASNVVIVEAETILTSGFPETMNIGDSYTDDNALRMYIRDENNDPVTEYIGHSFTDPDFEPKVTIAPGPGERGRVIADVSYVVPGGLDENYLKVEIPVNQSKRAVAGISTVQVLLTWGPTVQKTLFTTTVEWLARL